MAPNRLTNAYVISLRCGTKPVDVSDPGMSGLVIRLWPSGTKSWLFRYMWNRQRIRLALGSFPTVSLHDARTKAHECRQLIERGIDPRKSRREHSRGASHELRSHCEAVGTHLASSSQKPDSLPAPDPQDKTSVAFLAHEYVERFVRPNRENTAYVVRVLKKDVLPNWQDRDARTISAREVIELLDDIVQRGSPVMANRTADILGQMFKFGIHRAIVEDSPVKLLFRPGGKEKSRKRVFKEKELINFLQHLDKACRSKQKRHVLMLLLLTLQRRSELGLAEWKEFDFHEKIWLIPDEHSKNRRGHIVPLTEWAISELQELKKLANGSRFVLPSNRPNKPANPKLITRSVARCLGRFRKIGIEAFRPHDLRRTGRTELARIGVNRHIAERVLNHSKEIIEGTYDLHEYLDEKRDALNRWESRLRQLKDSSAAQVSTALTRNKTAAHRLSSRLTKNTSPHLQSKRD